MTIGVPTSCIEGVSTYKNPLDGSINPYRPGVPQTPVTSYAPANYGGAVSNPVGGTRFPGENILNGLAATAVCTEATRPFGEGRDNFYRGK